ncbi:MAG: hypothetical protein CMP65_01305 [Flavobacteriales bacterium]|nr:hypothetical protein [Flavobacteriales bacterium]
MRILFICFFFFSNYVCSQDWWGIKFGVTTVTPTGNYDSYDFDFIDSFTPSYEFGLFGNFQLSDIIRLKPEFSVREYILRQQINSESLYEITQAHRALTSDLNFDIKLSQKTSLIFGMGVDYILHIKNNQFINNESVEVTQLLASQFTRKNRYTPFSNIGLCFKLGRRVFMDLEYRHLLNNIKSGNLLQGTLVTLESGGVKLHMISTTLSVLF